MDYASSVKFDRWSSSDSSDQDERNKSTAVFESASSSSSTRRKRSFAAQLSRSFSRSTNDVMIDNIPKTSKAERPTDFGKHADQLTKTNEIYNKNGKATTCSDDERRDNFEDENKDLIDDEIPHLRRAVANVAVNDPSYWRRSAVRIKGKAKSFAKADSVSNKVNDRRKAKMSLQQPMPFVNDVPREISPNNKTHRVKKMSLQVPIPRDSSTSPMSDGSPNFKSYLDLEDESVENVPTSYMSPMSPNVSSSSSRKGNNVLKQDKNKRKTKRVSTILKPVWESERVSSFVEKATEKAKPFLESEVGSYLVDKVDKVTFHIPLIATLL